MKGCKLAGEARRFDFVTGFTGRGEMGETIDWFNGS
jgi:hypothetical protein